MDQARQQQAADGPSGEAFYKALLESTKAIPWQIDWKTMRFTYIGPQIQTLLGWTADSWVSAEDWAARMHPDDREKVVNFCISQSQHGIDHEADYRALTAEGNYIWIRDVVHVIRVNGEVESLVGFMFDISERKKNEEELLRLKQELEVLSFQDSLTGVGNRRLFDQQLARAWASARRDRHPLSLIMLDVDEFKKFNDLYGHSEGDQALQSVTRQMLSVLRASDLAARLGGEEFAILLPDTNARDARLVAERIRTAIVTAAIPHATSPADGVLTASLGVGTITPDESSQMEAFVTAVDGQLYQAKRSGRNGVAGGAITLPAVRP